MYCCMTYHFWDCGREHYVQEDEDTDKPKIEDLDEDEDDEDKDKNKDKKKKKKIKEKYTEVGVFSGEMLVRCHRVMWQNG